MLDRASGAINDIAQGGIIEALEHRTFLRCTDGLWTLSAIQRPNRRSPKRPSHAGCPSLIFPYPIGRDNLLSLWLQSRTSSLGNRSLSLSKSSRFNP